MKMQKFQTNAAINNPETGDALPQFFDVSEAECEASIKPHTVAIHAYCEKNEIPMLAAVQRRNTADSYGMTGSTLIPGTRAGRRVHMLAHLRSGANPLMVMMGLQACDDEDDTTPENNLIHNPKTGESFSRDFELSDAEYNEHIAPHVEALKNYCIEKSLPLICVIQTKRSGKEVSTCGVTVIPGNRATSAVKAMAELANNSSIDEVLGALMSKD